MLELHEAPHTHDEHGSIHGRKLLQEPAWIAARCLLQSASPSMLRGSDVPESWCPSERRTGGEMLDIPG